MSLVTCKIILLFFIYFFTNIEVCQSFKLLLDIDNSDIWNWILFQSILALIMDYHS